MATSSSPNALNVFAHRWKRWRAGDWTGQAAWLETFADPQRAHQLPLLLAQGLPMPGWKAGHPPTLAEPGEWSAYAYSGGLPWMRAHLRAWEWQQKPANAGQPIPPHRRHDGHEPLLRQNEDTLAAWAQAMSAVPKAQVMLARFANQCLIAGDFDTVHTLWTHGLSPNAYQEHLAMPHPERQEQWGHNGCEWDVHHALVTQFKEASMPGAPRRREWGHQPDPKVTEKAWQMWEFWRAHGGQWDWNLALNASHEYPHEPMGSSHLGQCGWLWDQADWDQAAAHGMPAPNPVQAARFAQALLAEAPDAYLSALTALNDAFAPDWTHRRWEHPIQYWLWGQSRPDVAVEDQSWRWGRDLKAIQALGIPLVPHPMIVGWCAEHAAERCWPKVLMQALLDACPEAMNHPKYSNKLPGVVALEAYEKAEQANEARRQQVKNDWRNPHFSEAPAWSMGHTESHPHLVGREFWSPFVLATHLAAALEETLDQALDETTTPTTPAHRKPRL